MPSSELLDTTALFLHVLAAVGMLGGGVMQVMAGTRVRGATTGEALHDWASFTRLAGLVVLASAVVSLLTGGHLAGAVWTTETRSGFAEPFITLGVAGLVLLAPVGPMVGGRALRSLLDATVDEGPLAEGARATATSAAVWGPIHSLLGVGVGLIALMVYKPSWWVGAVVLLVTFAVGWATGVVVSRPSRQQVGNLAGSAGTGQ